MSKRNVEIVRSIYEATNRRDWDVVFRDQHPDTEQILSFACRPVPGARGSSGLLGGPSGSI
jgi:ketosteroid isomerase-like protein